MKNGDVLSAFLIARNYIRDPEHWTQWALSKTSRGSGVWPTHLDATRWCSVGALYKTLGGAVDVYLLSILDNQAEPFGFRDVAHLNDYTNHEQVMEFWDAAITYVMLCIAAHIPADPRELS